MHKKVCSKGLNKVSLLERWHLTEQRFKGPGKGAMELAGESSGPRELVCECTRALAGLSEGRARVPEDVWPGQYCGCGYSLELVYTRVMDVRGWGKWRKFTPTAGTTYSRPDAVLWYVRT